MLLCFLGTRRIAGLAPKCRSAGFLQECVGWRGSAKRGSIAQQADPPGVPGGGILSLMKGSDHERS